MLVFGLLGCVTTTGGERVEFSATAEAVGEGIYEDSGWTVALDRAELAVGPIYLWSGQPLVDVPTFDIDHFQYGFLRGEVLDQVTVDLLDPESTPIGSGDGLAGEALSGELWLVPPDDGPTLLLEGQATRDFDVVPFRAELSIDDSVIDAEAGQTAFEQRKVRGIPLQADVAGGGTLVVGIDPTRMLVGVDFAELLVEEPDDGFFAIEPESPIWAGLYYQIRQSGDSGPWRLDWRQE